MNACSHFTRRDMYQLADASTSSKSAGNTSLRGLAKAGRPLGPVLVDVIALLHMHPPLDGVKHSCVTAYMRFGPARPKA